jgi:hypothetical protein
MTGVPDEAGLLLERPLPPQATTSAASAAYKVTGMIFDMTALLSSVLIGCGRI